jgi:uncharacterized protein
MKLMLLFVASYGLFAFDLRYSAGSSSAIEEYHRLAESGNVRAQAVIGELALERDDVGEAFRWLTVAAEAGDTEAQLKAAGLSLAGRGALRNPAKAAHFLALAAARSAEAQWRLGQLFEQGNGVPPSLAIAAAMFRRSADQDFAQAQNSLGDLYIAGRGVTQDFHEAARLYRKAAAQNCVEAQLNLAALYLHGIGVERDLAAARQWALKARLSRAQAAEDMLERIDRAASTAAK